MRPALIAGARPNFVKVAPLLRALESNGADRAFLVHTGQHYDDEMSASFFRDLDIRSPDTNLSVGSGSHARQTAAVMSAFDGWLDEHPEVDMVVVFGDVNSTVACTLVAAKRGIPVAHVEAGLRSLDRSMPEEVNRLSVDVLARWLLTPSADASANLIAEGAHPSRVQMVGNIMVDSLFYARDRRPSDTTADHLGLRGQPFALVTLHRPAFVDDPSKLRAAIAAFNDFSETIPLIFPAHPRTASMLRQLDVVVSPNLHLCGPLTYLDFVACQTDSSIVITDSGGVQEETTCLGVPCITMRDNTERPITVEQGTNEVVGTNPNVAVRRALQRLSEPTLVRRPPLWDGCTAGRIVTALQSQPVFN